MTGHRARIRMYRHGLGDCLLVRLPRQGKPDYRILIDCGVILGTQDAKAKINAVVDDVIAETAGELDLLVLTHAHGDHVSGFLQAKEKFSDSLKIGEVWMAWTENPKDAFAQSLVKDRAKAIQALGAARNQMQAAGDGEAAGQVGSLLDFFGIDGVEPVKPGANTTEGAVQFVRDLAPEGGLRYCEPGQEPYQPQDVNARILVLGPPRDAKLIRKSTPSQRAPETYDVASLGLFVNRLGSLADEDGNGQPFSSLYTIPIETAKTLPFFRKTYWTGSAAGDDWRAIDDIGLGSALDLALKLDSDTNNSSLVLAIELDGDSLGGQPGRDVLLFAADAQIGNWLSWKDVKWPATDGGAKAMDGLDLVRRTLVYKVGHHGSHNATLKDYLESMERLLIALNPVDEVMAGKKGWAHIPLPSLQDALVRKSSKRLVRADRPLETAATAWVADHPLFYEVTV